MRFHERSDPSLVISKSLPSLSAVKTKKKNYQIDVPDKRQSSNVGHRKSTSETGNKKCPILPRSTKISVGSFDEEYDIDFEKQFSKERLSDENECMWLSSDCSSPSSFFDQYSSPESDHEWLDDVFLASHVKDEEEESGTWLFSPLENETTRCNLDSQTEDFDGVTLMLSLVNLNHEHSEEHVLSEARCSFCSESGGDLECDCRDEPLFWPFKSKFNREAEESMKYFCMSPRKNNVLDRSKTLDLRGGCRRRLEFGTVNLRLNTGNNLRRNNTMPSRLSITRSRTLQDLLILEDDGLLTIYDNDEEESPIEKFLGLDEFDGHEGVDLDFNRDSFSLDGSFRKL